MVYFFSDEAIATVGFSAAYEMINMTNECGGELESPYGEIVTPGFSSGQNYPISRDCTWIINAPSMQQIYAQFNSFNLEYGSTCQYDYVEIRNGDQADSALVGKYCGITMPPPVTSTHNHLWVHFFSDEAVTQSGFRLAYDATLEGCGGELVGAAGELHSPNYPFPYNHNADCQYVLRSSAGSSIDITFLDFNMEASSTCYWDWLQIFDGPTTGYNPLTPRLCGISIPDPVNSTSHVVTVEFRTDSSISGRGWKLTYVTNMNKTISYPWSGLIQSPNYPYQYPNDIQGQWLIQGPLGSTVTITMNDFTVQSCSALGHCSCDSLQLYDGPDRDSDVLGRYCGAVRPLPITSTGNEVFVVFETDSTITADGFELHYNITVCAELKTDDSGQLRSANYPNFVTSESQCFWIVMIEPGNKIQLSITDLTLASTSCETSYVRVYNGETIHPEFQLLEICGNTQLPKQTQSTGSEMIVTMLTDNGNNKMGASYSSLPGGCGAHYIKDEGTFESPNYPDVYPHNSDCEWLIETSSGTTVNLYFEAFYLEGSGNSCFYDYVRVYDGPNQNSALLGTFCGQYVPEPVRGSSNAMFVRFQSDASIAYGGFKATFNTDSCGEVILASDDGNIQSPNYPDPYPYRAECRWTIKAPTFSENILLTVSYMDTFVDPYNGNEITCVQADYIQIYEGQIGTDIPKYCGTTLPLPYVSSGNQVKVYFYGRRSTTNNQRHGFFATYTTATDSCGGEYWAAEGYFSSPGYGTGSYPVSTTCEWMLTSSPGNKVALSFTDFNLQASSSSGTCYDYVEIRENHSAGTLLAKICGESLPSNVTTYTSHLIYVKFYSNSATVGRGFMAYYSHSYGGSIIASVSGQIASPLYPHNYPKMLDVYWTLYVRYNHLIAYEFIEFGTEAHVSCEFDYLRMYDGEDTSATLIGTYCGTSLPPHGVSSDDKMMLYFYSDQYYEDVGFLMNWTDSAQGDIPDDPAPPVLPPNICGSDYVVAPNYAMPMSMNYSPDLYPAGMECIWNLYTTRGSTILFTIIVMDLEGSQPYCSFDYIQVFDGPSITYPLLTKTCGRTEELPLGITSTSDMMTVRFRTDSSIQYSGWNATYQKGCGGLKTDRQGQLNSPNWPNAYPDNADCDWLIRVTNGYTLNLNFNTNYNIDGTGNYCNESASIDYMELRNGAESDAPPLTPPGAAVKNSDDHEAFYCGSTQPATMTSSGNEVRVRFRSNDQHTSPTTTYSGFAIRWSAVGTGCGGDYEITDSNPNGWFTSPNYPEDYDHNLFCIWTIRSPVGTAIRLDFHDFDVEDASGCVYDYVKIFDDEFDHDEPVATYCGIDIPDTTRTHGNVMIVKMRTDAVIAGKGFNATYEQSGCGGMVGGIAGDVTYNEYPLPYPAESFDCEYVVRAPAFHNVNSMFVGDFNVPGSMFARCEGGDYLEFRDYRDAGYFYLRNPSSDLVVTINSNVNSDDVQVNTHQGLYTQLWMWDFDHIVSVYDDTKVLSAAQASPTVDTNVHVEEYTGADHQRWEWTTNGQLLNKNSTNLVLTILGNGNAGSTLGVRTLSTSNVWTQLWQFEHTKIGRQLGIFCGNSAPTSNITSSDRALIVKHHSESGNSGKWKLTWTVDENVCGGEYTGDSGTITSPNFPNPPDTNRACRWHIIADMDRAVKLTFTSVNMGQLSCYYDYIKVYNGIRDNSPLFWQGTICYTTVPSPFISAGNTMRIDFQSSGYGYNAGFSANYVTNENRFCGGERNIVNPTDVNYIVSPGYPEEYPNNTECEWIISSPTRGNETIYFDFIEFDLEDHSTCDYDRLEFRVPLIDSNAVYATLCGNTMPEPFALPSTTVDVVFQSDDLDHGKFNMSYTIKPCGGFITGQSQGVIASPNFPSAYNHNDYCIWLIEVDVGHSIGVHWDDFEVEGSITDGCLHDAVSLYNGPSLTYPELGRYCDSNPPPTLDIHTANNYLTILFISDHSVASSGWKLTWSADNSGCGNQQIHATEGQIQSPGYPTAYSSNMNCFWTIFTEESSRINLAFTNFELEGSEPSCSWDYVILYDGDSITAPQIGGRMCGLKDPFSVESGRHILFVRFRTDSSINKPGFAAEWTTVCGQTINSTGEVGESGMIVSPNYPAPYPGNFDCRWGLNGADTTDFVRLHFVNFNLEIGSNGGCPFDFVRVYKGSTISSSRLLGEYCGSDLPPSSSTHGSMLIHFQTDHIIEDTGFKLEYDFESCGGIREGPSGEINGHTPTDDWSDHRNQNCTWIIMVGINKAIELKFSLFDIEYHPNCENDYVSIYDGPDTNSRMIGKYCGSTPPSFILTRQNYMTIEYVTDYYETKDGFMAEWRETIGPADGCGGELTEASGGFESPDPTGMGTYDNLLNCVWMISTTANNIIQLQFDKFIMEVHSSGGGCYDYVEVIDGQLTTDHGKIKTDMFTIFGPILVTNIKLFLVIYRQCGTQTNIPLIISSGNFLRVRMHSDSSIVAEGFNATYDTAARDCGATLTSNADFQTVSYNHEGLSGNTLIYRCSWFISASSINKYVDVETTAMDIPGSSDSNCAEGYLEYRDYGLPYDDGQHHRYCNADTQQLPPPFFSLTDTMQILMRNRKNQNSSFTFKVC
mgnify:CR=1 FL=1